MVNRDKLINFHIQSDGYLESSNDKQKYALVRLNDTFILKYKTYYNSPFIDYNATFSFYPPYSDFYINFNVEKSFYGSVEANSIYNYQNYNHLEYIFKKNLAKDKADTTFNGKIATYNFQDFSEQIDYQNYNKEVLLNIKNEPLIEVFNDFIDGENEFEIYNKSIGFYKPLGAIILKQDKDLKFIQNNNYNFGNYIIETFQQNNDLNFYVSILKNYTVKNEKFVFDNGIELHILTENYVDKNFSKTGTMDEINSFLDYHATISEYYQYRKDFKTYTLNFPNIKTMLDNFQRFYLTKNKRVYFSENQLSHGLENRITQGNSLNILLNGEQIGFYTWQCFKAFLNTETYNLYEPLEVRQISHHSEYCDKNILELTPKDRAILWVASYYGVYSEAYEAIIKAKQDYNAEITRHILPQNGSIEPLNFENYNKAEPAKLIITNPFQIVNLTDFLTLDFVYEDVSFEVTVFNQGGERVAWYYKFKFSIKNENNLHEAEKEVLIDFIDKLNNRRFYYKHSNDNMPMPNSTQTENLKIEAIMDYEKFSEKIYTELNDTIQTKNTFKVTYSIADEKDGRKAIDIKTDNVASFTYIDGVANTGYNDGNVFRCANGYCTFISTTHIRIYYNKEAKFGTFKANDTKITVLENTTREYELTLNPQIFRDEFPYIPCDSFNGTDFYTNKPMEVYVNSVSVLSNPKDNNFIHRTEY